MKTIKFKDFILALLLLICLCAMITGIVSCNYTKKISTSKQSYDSTTLFAMQDSTRLLKKQIEALKQTILEKATTDVVFDNTVCPPCPKLPHIPDNLALMNKDSVNVLIHDLNNLIAFQNNYMAGLENKVKVYADGTKEYSGKLKSFKQTDEKKQEIINNLIRESDSLRDVLQQNNTTVAKVAETKRVEVEVVVFPWYFWLITGGFALLWLNKQFKII